MIANLFDIFIVFAIWAGVRDFRYWASSCVFVASAGRSETANPAPGGRIVFDE
jgi:hypothetical protein